MKKIVLITTSLALLASPAFAENNKTVGAAPADFTAAKISGADLQCKSGLPDTATPVDNFLKIQVAFP